MNKNKSIVVELTTKENASKSWDDVEKMIKKYPYHAKSEGFGGGFFENIEEIKRFYSRLEGACEITGCGNWEVKNGD